MLSQPCVILLRSCRRGAQSSPVSPERLRATRDPEDVSKPGLNPSTACPAAKGSWAMQLNGCGTAPVVPRENSEFFSWPQENLPCMEMLLSGAFAIHHKEMSHLNGRLTLTLLWEWTGERTWGRKWVNITFLVSSSSLKQTDKNILKTSFSVEIHLFRHHRQQNRLDQKERCFSFSFSWQF